MEPKGKHWAWFGDNVANVNTVGFKAQRAIFQDILGRTVGATDSAGAGVQVGNVQQLFTQGALTNTGVATDLALSGDGFFVVEGQVSGAPGKYYTREGQFRLNQEGFLVNSAGLQVSGLRVDSGGRPVVYAVGASGAGSSFASAGDHSDVGNRQPRCQ